MALPSSGDVLSVSTAPEDQPAHITTHAAIRDGLRQDGATFKFPSGPRATSNADMTAVVMAVMAHVQAQFDLEGGLAGDIASGELTTLAEVDAVFSTA